MKKVILKIDGLPNSTSAMKLERLLNKNSSIKSAAVNWKQKKATIQYQEPMTIEEIEQMIQASGYESLGVDMTTGEEGMSIIPLIILGICFLGVCYLILTGIFDLPFSKSFTFPQRETIRLILGTIFVLYGLDLILEGIKNIGRGKSNRYSLLSLCVGIPYIYSVWNTILFLQGNGDVNHAFFEEIVFLIIIAKIGKYIDVQTKNGIAKEIKQISKQLLTRVEIKDGDTTKEIHVSEIKENDKIVCLPGDRILVDGIVTDGSSHLDESLINGTSQPILKQKNDKVVEGSINCENELEYIIDTTEKESNLLKVMKLTTEEKNNHTIEPGKVDKLCRLFVPFIMIICILFGGVNYFLFKNGEYSETFMKILISIPVGFLIASPLSLKRSMKHLKRGFLIKQSEILESIRKVDTIVIDKTGTLTNGYLSISRVNNHSELNDKELLELLGSVEKHSTHAIARGITKYLRSEKIKATKDFITEDLLGYGVKAKDEENIYYACNGELLDKLDIINSYAEEERKMKLEGNDVIYLTKNSKVIATFGLKDTLRKESKKFIRSLKERGLDVILLTGDDEITTGTITRDLEIEKAYARVGVKEKNEFVKNLQKEGRKVMMIGDGINDAPSLASAYIGVSLTNTSNVPPSAASIVLTSNNLGKVLEMFSISKTVSSILKTNILFSLIIACIMSFLCLGIIPKITMNTPFLVLGILINLGIICINTLRIKK